MARLPQRRALGKDILVPPRQAALPGFAAKCLVEFHLATAKLALSLGGLAFRFLQVGQPELGHGENIGLGVWASAEALAQQAGGSVTANELRHACHRVALGSDKSAKALTNAEADSVVALFNLLAAPEDLDAMLAWQNPEAGAVKRLAWAIEHAAPAAYVEALASDKFGTRARRSLPEASLRQLALTLRLRRPGGAAKL